jgi:hypothetical protein
MALISHDFVILRKLYSKHQILETIGNTCVTPLMKKSQQLNSPDLEAE